VSVDPDTFAAWCALTGRKPNSPNRAAFAAIQFIR
jgi:hypothetical protein